MKLTSCEYDINFLSGLPALFYNLKNVNDTPVLLILCVLLYVKGILLVYFTARIYNYEE